MRKAGRIHRHEMIKPLLLLRGEFVPSLHFRWARGERPGRIDEAHFLLSRVAFLAQFVPALHVDAMPKLFDLLSRSLQREMRSVVREIQEERLLFPERLVDEADSVI